MSLIDEVKSRSQEIKTDSYSMSINEIVSLYKEDELLLRPEFQRHFRWTPEQKSRFIESVLLGIPIPPIFVGQEESGKWELIDGLQRVSTLLHLMGELKDEDGTKKEPLVLSKPKLLPSLEKNAWIGQEKDGVYEIPVDIKLKLKRARLDINIIIETNSSVAKYELFQRLNTGGSFATDQEIRNCLLIMVNKEFYKWFLSLKDDENFMNAISVSERLLDEQYELELATRFLVFRKINADDIPRIGDLASFLDDEIIKTAQDSTFNCPLEKEIFRKVFAKLHDVLQDEAFRRYDRRKKKVVGPFIISVFEIMALGLGYHYNNIDKITNDDIIRIHRSIFANPKPLSVSGMSAATRLAQTIRIGRESFNG